MDSTKDRIRKLGRNTIFLSYLIALSFVLVFFLVLWKGREYNPNLDNPVWAAVIALACAIPPVLPDLFSFLKNRLATISYAGLSVSFTDRGLNPGECSWDALKRDSGGESGELTEGRISGDGVVNRIWLLQTRGCSQYILDIDRKRSWNLGLLFFYLKYIRTSTRVRQIIFVEMTKKPDRVFIGRVNLSVLLEELAEAFPEYSNATKDAIVVPGLDPWNPGNESSFIMIVKNNCGKYHEALSAALLASGKTPVSGIDRDWIVRFCAGFINTDRVEERECLTDDDIRAVLRCRNRCVAVVDHGIYRYTIDRDRFALNLARRCMCVKK